MDPKPTVKLNLKGLQHLAKSFKAQEMGKSGHIRNALQLVVTRYASWVRRRFIKYSNKGGNWPDLKPATKLARARKGKRSRYKKVVSIIKTKSGKHVGRSAAGRFVKLDYKILRDTGMLLEALSIGGPGNLLLDFPKFIRFGFDATKQHKGSKLSIQRLAVIHDQGLGNVPKRSILVTPPQEELDRYAKIIGRGVEMQMKESADHGKH